VTVAVLVVDDMEAMRLLVRTASRCVRSCPSSGKATSGEEALELVDGLDPEVVLLDQHLPGISGLQAAALILERRSERAIVLFSSLVDQQLRDDAAQVGVWTCVDKTRLGALPDTLLQAAAAVSSRVDPDQGRSSPRSPQGNAERKECRNGAQNGDRRSLHG